MKISMLIENERDSGEKQVKTEKGIAIYLELENRKILFDTGMSGAFLDNAACMGIDLEKVDTVVISHAHNDHTGGLLRFLEQNGKARVYMSRYATQRCFVKFGFFRKDVSVPSPVFEQYRDRITFVDGFTEIGEDIYLVPNITRYYGVDHSGKNMLVEKDGRYEEDRFDHELAMIVNDNERLSLFTGCSHNGIINIVETVKDYFQEASIRYIIGGLHLQGMLLPAVAGEREENVRELGDRILEYNVEKVYTCHCTGRKAYSTLKDVLGDRIDYLYAGRQVIV